MGFEFEAPRSSDQQREGERHSVGEQRPIVSMEEQRAHQKSHNRSSQGDGAGGSGHVTLPPVQIDGLNKPSSQERSGPQQGSPEGRAPVSEQQQREQTVRAMEESQRREREQWSRRVHEYEQQQRVEQARRMQEAEQGRVEIQRTNPTGTGQPRGT